MRKDFVTKFWQDAYENLPVENRTQYLAHMKAAESWELALGDLVQVWSRAKNAFLRLVHVPT